MNIMREVKIMLTRSMFQDKAENHSIKRKTVDAISCKQNNKEFIVTVLDSDTLKTMCFVSRKKENPLKGFQRLLNGRRAKQIAQYLDDKGIIPSALIVSAQGNAKLAFDEKRKKLSFTVTEESFLVIDGQHRLYGLREAKGTYQIPVIIFNSLNSSDEIKLFIDINTTQKGVPMALILDIKNQAGTETKIEERQRILFDSLNKDSALAGYFLPNESKSGKISRTVFNTATKSVFENGPLSTCNDEQIYAVVKNYVNAIDSLFKESENPNARLTKSVLFKAFFSIFSEVCDHCLIKFENLKYDSFKEYLAPIKSLNFDEYTGTNKATETKISNEIKFLIRSATHLSEDMF